MTRKIGSRSQKNRLIVRRVLLAFGVGLAAVALASGPAQAHSGGTDSGGGHHCWTNCSSHGLAYGEYHYHGGSSTGSGNYEAPFWPTWYCVTLDGSALTRSDIYNVQLELMIRNIYSGSLNGHYDKSTRAALNKFEKRNGLRKSDLNGINSRSIQKLGAAC